MSDAVMVTAALVVALSVAWIAWRGLFVNHAVTLVVDLKVRDVLPVIVEHSLDPKTAARLADVVADALAQQHQYALVLRESEPVPDAEPLAMPPEPEERMANDFLRAQSVMRGAASLMAVAQEQQRTMSQAEAMQQAARMLGYTFHDLPKE